MKDGCNFARSGGDYECGFGKAPRDDGSRGREDSDGVVLLGMVGEAGGGWSGCVGCHYERMSYNGGVEMGLEGILKWGMEGQSEISVEARI